MQSFPESSFTRSLCLREDKLQVEENLKKNWQWFTDSPLGNRVSQQSFHSPFLLVLFFLPRKKVVPREKVTHTSHQLDNWELWELAPELFCLNKYFCSTPLAKTLNLEWGHLLSLSTHSCNHLWHRCQPLDNLVSHPLYNQVFVYLTGVTDSFFGGSSPGGDEARVPDCFAWCHVSSWRGDFSWAGHRL